MMGDFSSNTLIAAAILVLCFIVPAWFSISRASYQSIASLVRSGITWFPALFGLVIATTITSMRLLGAALVIPWIQLAILAGAARAFEIATGEPLKHIPIQWTYMRKTEYKHAIFDLLASVVGVAAPLYVMHLLIGYAANDSTHMTQ